MVDNEKEFIDSVDILEYDKGILVVKEKETDKSKIKKKIEESVNEDAERKSQWDNK